MIYLLHHADAVGPEIDPQRPLSAEGRRHAEALSADAAVHGVRPEAIWHSGKLRARQTAEFFRNACNPLAEFRAVRGLQPGDPPDWISDQLAGEERSVLLVGHMPSLPRLLRRLAGDDASRDFPQHGLVALSTDGARWTEAWRLP